MLEEDRSVISGLTHQGPEGRPHAADGARRPAASRTLTRARRRCPTPKTLRPMLATLVEAPFSRAGWLFEPKLDGVRTLAFAAATGKVDLRSRRGNEATVQYPEVVEAVAAQRARVAVFDGEIVALNERGAPDFQELQPRINLSRPAEVARVAAETPAYYYVFDLLYLDGYDLHARAARRAQGAAAARARARRPHQARRVHRADDGEQLYGAASELGFEGIVAKRATSTYEAGRRAAASWLKVKNVIEQEFVVGGYTEGEGSRSKTFGGLLVGYYEGDDAALRVERRLRPHRPHARRP